MRPQNQKTPKTPILPALLACLLPMACQPAGVDRSDEPTAELEATSAALDSDGAGGGFGDGETGDPDKQGSAPKGLTARQRLDAAKKAMGFTSSDPATWSDAKKKEVCELYATSVRARFNNVLAFAPAYEACMTGQDQELGMWAYQTLAMRAAGFMPSEPRAWSPDYMRSVCDMPEWDVRTCLTPVYGGAIGTSYGLMAARWCETFGDVGPWTEMHDPPSGWDYANWEFRAWKRDHPFNWGQGSGEAEPAPVEPPH